jgi:hypothetical protein
LNNNVNMSLIQKKIKIIDTQIFQMKIT